MIKSDYDVSPASYSFENARKVWLSSAFDTLYSNTSSSPNSLAELSRHAILVLPTMVLDEIKGDWENEK